LRHNSEGTYGPNGRATSTSPASPLAIPPPSVLSAVLPLSSNSRFTLACPTDPDSFAAGPEFDILSELANNREEYSPTEKDVQLTIYKFPSSLLMLIDQTREKVPMTGKHSSRPGRNPTLACCLSYGLQTVASNSDVREMVKLRARFSSLLSDRAEDSTRDPIDLSMATAFYNFLDNFPCDIRDHSGSQSRKQWLSVGEKLKLALFNWKANLALSFDNFAVLCVQVALQEQTWILAEAREQMAKSVERFYRSVRVRQRFSEILLAEIER
jgi:hypothetical protein